MKSPEETIADARPCTDCEIAPTHCETFDTVGRSLWVGCLKCQVGVVSRVDLKTAVERWNKFQTRRR